jgi:lipopolysaccharide export system permease protein
MGRLERYILLNAGGAFIGILVVLTSMIWLATALRKFDLVTSQGQTILVFFTITGLSLPALMAVIAPIALFIAIAYTFHRLNSDSELVVMSAAGMKPWQFFRAPLLLSIIVAILSWIVTADIGPRSLLFLREEVSKVNADIITNVAIPGKFSKLENGLTFHIRERSPNGVLLGVFMNDERTPDRYTTFIADRGRVMNSGQGLFLILEQGTLHRSNALKPRDTGSVVEFEGYAFELSRLSSAAEVSTQRASLRTLPDLIWPEHDDKGWADDSKGHRVELHKRLSAPLYPIAAFAIAFAFLGSPRTTRQSRGLSIAGAASVFLFVEIVGLGSSGFVERSAAFAPLPYIVPILAIAVCTFVSMGDRKTSIPEPLQRFADALVARFERLGTA